jgi:hypothetical protein
MGNKPRNSIEMEKWRNRNANHRCNIERFENNRLYFEQSKIDDCQLLLS